MNYYYILKKTLKSIFYSLNFYIKQPRNEPLLAVLPRTGLNLTVNLLNICYSIRLGLPGDLGVNDNTYSTFAQMDSPLDERSIFSKRTDPILWHSHLPYSKIVPKRKKFCKTVILIREPVECIASYLLHLINEGKLTHNLDKEVTMSEFRKFDKKFKLISVFSEFLKSWLNFKLKSKKDQVVVIDNYYVKKNTKDYLIFINKFFDLKFSQSQMNIALEKLDIERIKKISSIKSQRVTNNKILLSHDVKNHINKYCKEKYTNILKTCVNY